RETKNAPPAGQGEGQFSAQQAAPFQSVRQKGALTPQRADSQKGERRIFCCPMRRTGWSTVIRVHCSAFTSQSTLFQLNYSAQMGEGQPRSLFFTKICRRIFLTGEARAEPASAPSEIPNGGAVGDDLRRSLHHR